MKKKNTTKAELSSVKDQNGEEKSFQMSFKECYW